MEASVFLQGNATTVVKARIYMSELFLKVVQEFWFVKRLGKVATSLSQTGQVLLQERQLSLIDEPARQKLKSRLLPVEDS